ncbi:MAG: hypothetical protein KF744_17130 [Taibaiella sp.]|nr:hypothetical protein [Taibaiella sp.]
MNVINTDIVYSSCDVFWNELPEQMAGLKPAKVLVIGTTEDAEPRVRRMLDACKLAPEEYNLVFLGPDEHVSWHKLKAFFQPAVVFLIGVLPSQLGVSSLFRLHDINRYDELVLLPTRSIAYLDQHESEKKHLWSNSMKPLLLDRSFPKYFS